MVVVTMVTMLVLKLTCAHDESGGGVFGVDGPGHVRVVRPAQVEVQVTVRLRGEVTLC